MARGRESRLGQREDDSPEDGELRAPVEHGGLFEFPRQGEEELSHEEDAEGRRQRGEHHRGERVDQVQLAEHDVGGDDQQLGRDQDRGENEDEADIATGELQPREAVARERTQGPYGTRWPSRRR